MKQIDRAGDATQLKRAYLVGRGCHPSTGDRTKLGTSTKTTKFIVFLMWTVTLIEECILTSYLILL